jgi:hypothetical protein
MMFFPETVERLRQENPQREDIRVDNTYDDLEDDLVNLGEEEFDEEFEAIYEKMLRIGTVNLGATIANRAKGGNCPA